jgi:hypothetical protein
MDIKTRLSGLDELLAVIYNEVCLSTLLTELGFEQIQIEQLQGASLEPVVARFGSDP